MPTSKYIHTTNIDLGQVFTIESGSTVIILYKEQLPQIYSFDVAGCVSVVNLVHLRSMTQVITQPFNFMVLHIQHLK